MSPPPSPPTPPHAGDEKADDNHDVVGWDNAPEGKDVSWHPEPVVRPPSVWRKLWRRGRQVLMALMLLGMLAGVVLGITAWRQHRANARAVRHTEAAQMLYAFVTAQGQYIKKYDVYATAGWRFTAAGQLISLDVTRAFDLWQNNGDNAAPVVWRGWIFRMLQGDGQGTEVTSFYKIPGDPASGMVTYGIIARSVDPDDGDWQFYVDESGTTYYHPEPAPSDPKYKKFLLDWTLPQGPVSNEWLPAR